MKVVLQNLTKQFPGRGKKAEGVTAVSRFNFEIPDGKLGAPVHASISGRVLSITDRYIEIGG